MATVVYSCIVKPFTDMKMNYLDIFNECTIMLMAYATIPYSDYLADPHFKYQIGWVVIGGLCMNLGLNVGFIVIMSFVKIVKMIMNKRKQRNSKSKSKKEEASKVMVTRTNTMVPL